MKALSTVLLVLAAVAAVVWIGGYLWISGMACAFSGPGACQIRGPWALNREDFAIMVLIPGALVASLALPGLLLRPRR